LQIRRHVPRHRLGAEGEQRAALLLERKGYRIEARNVRAGGVEIDLVARRGGLVVFVEVKTRRSTRFGSPESAVDAAKQARLARGAAAWLRERGAGARRARFDVVAWLVEETSGGPPHWQGVHIESAFAVGD
jgi:putative endonuclease